MKSILRSVLSAEGGTLSSKRLCGVAGFFTVLAVYCYCSVCGTQMPDVTDMLLVSIVTLLGADSVTDIFKKRK